MRDVLRPVLAGLAFLAAGYLLTRSVNTTRDDVALLFPATLVLSAGLAFHRHALSQVVVRAAVWASMLFATAGALLADGTHLLAAVGGQAALVFGLASLGHRGLTAGDRSGAFRPVAFRGTLLVGAVISLVLAMWFTLLAAVGLVDQGEIELLWFGVAVLAISLSMVGLYRLQLWGLLLKGILDLSFLTLAGGMVLVEPSVEPAQLGILGLALFQVGISLPVWWAVLRHRPPTASVPAALVLLLELSLALALLGAGLSRAFPLLA